MPIMHSTGQVHPIAFPSRRRLPNRSRLVRHRCNQVQPLKSAKNAPTKAPEMRQNNAPETRSFPFPLLLLFFSFFSLFFSAICFFSFLGELSNCCFRSRPRPPPPPRPPPRAKATPSAASPPKSSQREACGCLQNSSFLIQNSSFVMQPRAISLSTSQDKSSCGGDGTALCN